MKTDDKQEYQDERAAILEYDGGHTREEAELAAWWEAFWKFDDRQNNQEK